MKNSDFPRTIGLPEDELHGIFSEAIRTDFYSAPEVHGRPWLDHPLISQPQPLRADFLIAPRPHLVDAGFPEHWIAVEIKRSGY
jgi:hypothetical protein